MADARFFTHNGSISLKTAIDLTGAKLASGGDILPQDFQIDDVAPLELANENHLSFLSNSRYIQALKNSKAGFCIIAEKFLHHVPNGMIVLVHENPYKAYAIIASKFYPQEKIRADIAKTAIISSKSSIGKNCSVGEFVVIEEGVVIGDNSAIDHHSVIKRNVVIGSSVRIASNVTISHAAIGDGVIIHPGVRIGQDGFGFASDRTGHLKVPQLGIVKIGNMVEIGANTTIDRGSSQDTIVGDMVQMDNLVQLGHNVVVGRACVIVAQAGIAGSTKVGDFTILGGQVGIAGHLKIGSGVQIAAQSGVAQDIEDGMIVGGTPSVPIRQWHRQNFTLARLVKEDSN